MPRRQSTLFAVVLTALLLSGCTRGVAVQTPTTAMEAPPTAIANAAASPTATPTGTPTATATPTPVPTAPSRATPGGSPATPTRAASRQSPTGGTPSSDGPRAPVFPTQPRDPGRPIAQTEHYQFFDPEGAHAATIALLAADAEAIYAYLVARTGLQAAAPIPVVVQTQAESDCAARGIAYRDGKRTSLFAGPNTSPAQLRLVLAHESAHILHMAHYGPDLDVTLVEGFAHWASLRYWSEWQGLASFDDAVRLYLADGRFVPVDNPPAACTIENRDVIYNERASFVGYLIDRYGLDAFLAASNTHVPTRRPNLPFTADYDAIYGKSLATLLDEWVASLKA